MAPLVVYRAFQKGVKKHSMAIYAHFKWISEVSKAVKGAKVDLKMISSELQGISEVSGRLKGFQSKETPQGPRHSYETDLKQLETS